METVGQRVKEYWVSEGVKIQPGASEHEIEDFHSRYGVYLPQEAQDYFRVVNGMEDGQMDGWMFAFHSLKAMRSVPEELAYLRAMPDYPHMIDSLPDAQHCFVFIDYFCFSHLYALRLTPFPSEKCPIIWVCRAKHRIIAGSLTEFLESYVANPRDVLFPKDL